MSVDSIIGIVAVVVGAILGYLASYLSNHQQRQWQLDGEYRLWQRAQIEKDMESMFLFIRKFIALAHRYVEYAESPNNELLKELLESTRANTIHYMKEELGPFPVALKSGSTKPILEDLDRITDDIFEIGSSDEVGPRCEKMRACLEKLRELERNLYLERQKMLEATFH
jgi:hypothetical protein